MTTPITVEQPESRRQLDRLVGRLKRDIYDDLFELLRAPQNHSDSVEAHATLMTERIMAYTEAIITHSANVTEALRIYHEVFNRAIVWVDPDVLREGLYRQVEKADAAVGIPDRNGVE